MESSTVQQIPEIHLLNVILVGDQSVGKTALMLRFADNKFIENHKVTVAVDSRNKKINIGKIQVKLQVWDTVGQERFSTLTQTYYRRADGVILAYDTTNQKTLESVKVWNEQVSKHCIDGVPKIIVGTKCDLPQNPNFDSKKEGETLATVLEMKHFQTSALQGDNVDQIFSEISQLMLDYKQIKQPVEKQVIKLEEKPLQPVIKKKKCCG